MRWLCLSLGLAGCGTEPVKDEGCGICFNGELCPVDEPADGDLCSDVVTDELQISCFYCDGDPATTRTWACGLNTDLRWEAQPDMVCDL